MSEVELALAPPFPFVSGPIEEAANLGARVRHFVTVREQDAVSLEIDHALQGLPGAGQIRGEGRWPE